MELQKRIDNVLNWDLGPIVVRPSRIKQGQDYQKVMKALCTFGEQFRERERVRVAIQAKRSRHAARQTSPLNKRKEP